MANNMKKRNIQPKRIYVYFEVQYKMKYLP